MADTPRRWWLLHWCFALLAVTGVVMVLIARGHYTVDCIIAYYITTRIFYIYHTLANNANLKVRFYFIDFTVFIHFFREQETVKK